MWWLAARNVNARWLLFCVIITSLLSWNKGLKVSISAMMHPTLQMSMALVYTAAPSSNSGAR